MRKSIHMLLLGILACKGEVSQEAELRPVTSVGAASPVTLDVVVSGCGTYAEGPVCRLRAGPAGALTLWAEIDPEFEASVWIDGVEHESDAVAIAGGQRWVVTPAVDSHALEIRARLDDQTGHFGMTLQPPAAARPAALEEIDALHAKAVAEPGAEPLAAVQQKLDALLPTLQGHGRAMGLMKVGALAASRGDAEAALTANIEAFEAARALGRQYDACILAQGLVWDHLTRRSDLGQARLWLERHDQMAGIHPDHRAYHAYFSAIVDTRIGDLRSALQSHRGVERYARAIGLQRLELASVNEQIRLAGRLGANEFGDGLHERARVLAEGLSTHDHVELLHTLAWAQLAARGRGRDAEDPTAQLQRALALLGEATDAFSTATRRTVLLSLAYGAVLDRRAADARRWLEASDPSALRYEDRLWHALLVARVALLDGDTKDARARYTKLLRDAESWREPDLQWLATLGLASTEQALGKLEAAEASYEAAETLLEAQLPRIAMGEGRERFVTERDRGARLRVELLLRLGKPDQALCAARVARTRALRTLARQMHALRRASAQQRESLAHNRNRRAELETELDASWGLSLPKARKVQRRVERERRALQDEVDALFAELDPTPAGLPVCEDFRRPAADTLDVHYMLLDDGWVAFGVDAGGVEVQRLGALDLPEPTTAAARVRLADALLKPFAAAIGRAEHVRVMPTGALTQVPFHALPMPSGTEGSLVEHGTVLYGLDLPRSFIPAEADEQAAKVALVIAPPSNLAHAPGETATTRQRLTSGGWVVGALQGDAATGDAVRRGLTKADLVHYVGHAHSDGLSGWDSALDLARDDTLEVEDVLALSRVPTTVVLNGCETGMADPEALAGGMSLAHAFVLGGARLVIATDDAVDDEAAAGLITTFYGALAGPDTSSPAVALRRAHVEHQGRSPAWLHTRGWVP
ncbi:MAG: CHAT domain-containing protein [Deltaproteobacteria bacterium]|nr:CHAT domain-containing protein [Deltaproteobacteria bacterium]